MRQIVPPQLKQKIRNFFLDLDARIDSTLFSSGKGLRELYERYSTFMDRFYVGRWKRWVFIEPLSEAATIGLGGLILINLLITFAIPGISKAGHIGGLIAGALVGFAMFEIDKRVRSQWVGVGLAAAFSVAFLFGGIWAANSYLANLTPVLNF